MATLTTVMQFGSELYDTFVNFWSANTNYGTNELITVGGGRVALLKFPSNLPSLPCLSATLELYCTYREDSFSGYPVDFYRLTSDWNELTVTYNTIPPQDFSKSWAKITSGNVNSWISVNITELFNAWALGQIQYGFAINRSNYAASFASSDSSNPLVRPRLTIVRESALYFYDPINTGGYLSDKINQGKQLDFAGLTAGQTSSIKPIGLFNSENTSVRDVIIQLENTLPGDIIEISQFNDPFIPSPEIHFDGTFAPNSSIGTFYVRVKPGEDSSGSKSFRIKAKATPV